MRGLSEANGSWKTIWASPSLAPPHQAGSEVLVAVDRCERGHLDLAARLHERAARRERTAAGHAQQVDRLSLDRDQGLFGAVAQLGNAAEQPLGVRVVG